MLDGDDSQELTSEVVSGAPEETILDPKPIPAWNLSVIAREIGLQTWEGIALTNFISLLESIEIDIKYIFIYIIKHIKIESWTKLVFTELGKEPKFLLSYTAEPKDMLILNLIVE